MRFTTFLAGAAIAAALSSPALATEQPGDMKLFDTVCMQHQGDMAGAEAAALAQGLPIMIDNRGKTITGDDMELVLRSTDERVTILVGPAPEELVAELSGNVMLCAIIFVDDDASLVAAGKALGTRMGLPEAFKDDPDGYMVFYRNTPQGMIGLPDNKLVLRQAVKAGEYRLLDARNGNGTTMVSMMSAWKE